MTAVQTKSDEVEELDVLEPSIAGERRRRRPSLSLPTWLNPASPAVIWMGLGLAGIGFVLIGIAWAQVAGETQVYLQLPYLASAGLTGLGLIMVGMTLINVAAKRRDAAERERQIDQLVSILEEVQTALGERPPAYGPRAAAVDERFLRDDSRCRWRLLVALMVAGFVAIGVGWRGVAGSLVVAVQLPYAVSGLFGGIAVIGFAAGLMSLQLSRRREAQERAEFARLVSASADLLAAVRAGEGARRR